MNPPRIVGDFFLNKPARFLYRESTNYYVCFMFKLLSIFCLILLFSACSKPAEHELGMYYWKMNTKGEQRDPIVSELDWMYVKLYDVKWREAGAYPASKQLKFEKIDSLFKKPIIPVIYITNDVFLKSDSSEVLELVQNLAIGLEDYQSMTDAWSEIQIDCDWTESSKSRYFQFLSAFRKAFPKPKISVTLRLYPFKYATKMGIPPVDKAMLMAYNVGQIQRWSTSNSILDYAEAKKYLTHSKYPLPLDLALPTFGWYVWFSHGRMRGIVYEEEFQLLEEKCKPKGNNRFTLTEDIETDQHLYFKGDEFRMEFPNDRDILSTYGHVLELYPSVNRIVFFHYNSSNIKRYENLLHSF